MLKEIKVHTTLQTRNNVHKLIFILIKIKFNSQQSWHLKSRLPE